jgi:uncharacterized lipoprotein YmbA
MTRTRTLRALAAGVVAALLLCACSATSPRTHFYTLDSRSQAAGASAGSSSPDTATVKVTVLPVSIPEMVDRPQLVLRDSPNQVEIADFHRWAEPLPLGIARVVADELAAQLGGGFLVMAGQRQGITPDVRVALNVQRFESVPGKGVSVEAFWSVLPAQGKPVSGRALAEEPARGTGQDTDFSALAAAHSRAIAQIARQVGTQIERLTP